MKANKQVLLTLLTCSALGQGAPAAAKVLNLEAQHVTGELLIKFKPQFRGDESLYLQQWNAKIKHRFRSGALLVSLDPQKGSFTDVSAALADDAMLLYAEANTVIRTNATMPNDPAFHETYGLHNTGTGGGKADADIDAPEAWDISTGSRDVVVGVIDTGIDYNHPDLKDNYWRNPGEQGQDAQGRDKASNGVDDDGNGYIDDWGGWDFANNDNDPIDDNQHGTHCAGTIGASGNDTTGVAGVAWTVSLVGIKFLSATGSGSLANAVKAIEYATSLGLDLTSNSWGGGGYSPTMAEALSAAHTAGILFVAAAGNSHSNNDSAPHYPSSYAYPNVVAVAASDNQDAMATFSNFGASSVHLAAPGDKIYSTTPGGGYAKLSGTSMATPHVAGALALMKSAYPQLSMLSLKDRLLKTVDPVPALKGKVKTGGRLNAYNALEDDDTPPGPISALRVSATTLTAVEISFAGTGDDGDTGTASNYEVRLSANAVQTEAEWQEARPVSFIRLDASPVSLKVHDLPYNSQGFLTVRGIDNVGNVGELAESIPFALKEVKKFAHYRGDTLDGIQHDDPWGLEVIAPRDNSKAFSDSPTGTYGANTNIAMTLPSQSVANNDVMLAFDTYYDLERGYDFGYVELSLDEGASWTTLLKLSGTATGWEQVTIDLSERLPKGPHNLRLRFRMTSDYSVAKDGWKIADVELLGASSLKE